MKNRWIIDLDSTLNNLCDVWLQWYNADYDDNLTPDKILSWDTHNFVKAECGTDIYDYLHFPDMFRELEPQPDSQEVTAKLVEDGYDLLIVSTCTPESYIPKVSFLKKYFPHIPTNNFISCGRKNLVIADGIVDDKYATVAEFPGNKILFAQPWNFNEWQLGKENIIRAGNWQIVDAAIRSLS